MHGRSRLLPTLSVGVLVAFVGFALAAGIRVHDLPPPGSPYLVAPVALLGGFCLGHRLTRLPPWVGGSLSGAALALLYVGCLWSLEPGKAPLSYPNANAAAALQAAALGAVVVLRGGTRPVIVTWFAGSALAICWINSSSAGIAVAAVATAAVAVTMLLRLRRRWWLIPCTTAAIGLAAYAMARLTTSAQWPGAINAALSPVRHDLWRDAWRLWHQDWWFGHGPGAFGELQTVSRDFDLRAAHSLPLEVGVDLGMVGVILVGLIVLIGLLWCVRAPQPVAAIAAAAWTGLAVHAQMDHLVEFVPVMILAGAVVGAAGSRGQKSSTSAKDKDQSPGAGGLAASGRTVSTGPTRGTGINGSVRPDLTDRT